MQRMLRSRVNRGMALAVPLHQTTCHYLLKFSCCSIVFSLTLRRGFEIPPEFSFPSRKHQNQAPQAIARILSES